MNNQNNKGLISEVVRIQQLMGVKKIILEANGGPGTGEVSALILNRLAKNFLPNFLKNVKLKIVEQPGAGFNRPKEYFIDNVKVSKEKYEFTEKLKNEKDTPTKLKETIQNNPQNTKELYSELKIKFSPDISKLENEVYEDTMMDVMKTFIKAAEEKGVKIDKQNFNEKEIYKLINREVDGGLSIPEAIEKVTGVLENSTTGMVIFEKLQENYGKYVNKDPQFKPLIFSNINTKIRKAIQDANRDIKTKPNFVFDNLASNKTIFNIFRKALLQQALRYENFIKEEEKFLNESVESIFSLLNRKIDEFANTPLSNIEKFESELRLIAQRFRIIKGNELFEGTPETIYKTIGEELEKVGVDKKEVDNFVQQLSLLDPYNPDSTLNRGWVRRFFSNTASTKYFNNFRRGLKIWKMWNQKPKEGFNVEFKDPQTGEMKSRPGTIGEYTQKNFYELIERFIVQCITGIPKTFKEYRGYFYTKAGGGEYANIWQGLGWLLVHTLIGLNVGNPLIRSIYNVCINLVYLIPGSKREGKPLGSIFEWGDKGTLLYESFAKGFQKQYPGANITKDDVQNAIEKNDVGLSLKIASYELYVIEPGLHGAPEVIYKFLDKVSRQEITYADLNNWFPKLSDENVKKLLEVLNKLKLNGMSEEELKKYLEDNKDLFNEIFGETKKGGDEIINKIEGSEAGCMAFLLTKQKTYKSYLNGICTAEDGTEYEWDGTNYN